MSTFADALSEKIDAEPGFAVDMSEVCASAMAALISVPRERKELHEPIKRLLQSASIFSQASSETRRALAQDLALYCAYATEESTYREAARGILAGLGNHPGASQLNSAFGIHYSNFQSYAADRLLRAHNSVKFDKADIPLTDFQYDVWSRMRDSKRVAISAPTSAGKSFLVVEYLCQEALRHSNYTAVFIAPTRALLTEIHAKIEHRLSGQSEIRVSTVPTPDPNSKPKQIFVLTQERLQVLLSIWAGAFDLVVVDEAQGIGEESRGIILQDSLEQALERSPNARFLFIAPSASGFDSLTQATGIGRIEVADTDVSPVLQNRIMVEPVAGAPKQLELKLITSGRLVDIGVYQGNRGFTEPKTALAAVALELGQGGGSLVYGPSASETGVIAAQIASGLSGSTSQALIDLSDFIVKHVHDKFSLAGQVLHGVATHYGNMPSLLRESIESAFKENQLKYLVCTTTLFQGVNLPARNVFIDTPARGRKGKRTQLDPAALWNFAGRAGRLGRDVVGNVFLVGYSKWSSQVLTEKSRFSIQPSFRRTVIEQQALLESYLQGVPLKKSRDVPVDAVKSAAGLLLSRAVAGSLPSFLDRTLVDKDENFRMKIAGAAEAALTRLTLPPEVLKRNWTVDPFGMAALYERLRELVKEGKADELIPINPRSEQPDPAQRYVPLFRRINRYILGIKGPGLGGVTNLVAYTSLSWMRGKPLPAVIADFIKNEEKRRAKKTETTGRAPRKGINYDSIIRKVFDFVEQELRFRYVQLGRAYIDILNLVLEEQKLGSRAKEIYDFPLALELGVSSAAGQVFIEIGLSRIAASTFEQLIPDSNPTPESAKRWLGGLAGTEFNLSAVIWDELRRKGLLKAVKQTT